MGETLGYETSKSTDVCFCLSQTGYKTQWDMNHCKISFYKMLKLQVLNDGLETSDGMHKIT